MSNKVQQLQTEIENAISLREKLKADEPAPQARLLRLETDLQEAILARESTDAIEAEITATQIKLSSIQKSITIVIEKISNLEQDLKNEIRAVALEKAETIKDEYLQQVDVIYDLLAKAITEIDKLKTKGIEYWQAIREAGAMQTGPHNDKIKAVANRINSLQFELKRILSNAKRKI